MDFCVIEEVVVMVGGGCDGDGVRIYGVGGGKAVLFLAMVLAIVIMVEIHLWRRR